MIFSGYFGEPEKYAETVKNGWIYSGDWGYFDEDGYLFVVDRIKHLLITSVKFPPKEIENIVNEIDEVVSSQAVSVHGVIYVFVIKRPVGHLNEETIKAFVNFRVEESKKITGVHFVEEFPLTTTRKIKKFELKKIAEKIYKENEQ